MSNLDPSVFDFETERLRLRLLGNDDEALFHELYTDPETMRYIARPMSAEQAAISFRKTVTRQLERSISWRFLVVLEKVTLRTLGICGTSHYDADNHRLEIGIVLKREARSHGYGREVLAALMEKVLAVSSVNDIWLRCATDNLSMERLSRTLHFTCRGKPPEDGATFSGRIWSISRAFCRASHTRPQAIVKDLQRSKGVTLPKNFPGVAENLS